MNLKNDGLFELNLDFFSHQKGNGQHTWNDGIPTSGDCFGEKNERFTRSSEKINGIRT